MANQVYANGREVSCKVADGKSICAFPDVCLSPPSPPAGPVPIPYPNTGFASDMTEGSKTVKISGKEVMLKDRSYFKKSTGDEAATKSLGMGVVTHQIQGKVYFNSWSMDVKFEGENVVRHLDLTTHNHASSSCNSPTWPFTERMAMAKGLKDCEDEMSAVQTNCQVENGKVQCPPQGNMTKQQYACAIQNDLCQRAARCILSPYRPSRCCPPQTPHHLVPKAGFYQKRYGGRKRSGCGDYEPDKAPCVCAEGGKSTGTHGLLHDHQAKGIKKLFKGMKTWKFSDAVKNASAAMKDVCGCNEKCTEAQLQREHAKMEIDKETELRPIAQEPADISDFRELWDKLLNSLKRFSRGSTR